MNANDVLLEAIQRWLDKNPNRRNLSMLSRLSNVSYSSVRRASIGEGNCKQDTLIALASVVMSKDELYQYIETYFSKLRSFMIHVNHESLSNDVDLMRSLRDQQYAQLIVFASHIDGVNTYDVTKRFGESYLTQFNELIEVGILKPSTRPGNFKFQDNIGNLSLPLARRVIANLSELHDDNYNRDLLKTAWFGFESLSVQAANEVNRILAEANQSIYDIISSEENKGDVLVFCSTLANVVKGS